MYTVILWKTLRRSNQEACKLQLCSGDVRYGRSFILRDAKNIVMHIVADI